MLSVPLVLLKSASTPLAVLSLPVLVNSSVASPMAVLLLPLVIPKSANVPSSHCRHSLLGNPAPVLPRQMLAKGKTRGHAARRVGFPIAELLSRV